MVLGIRQTKSKANGGPVIGLTRGVVAGVIGTTGMTALQELAIVARKVRSNGSASQDDDGKRADDPWSHAPAPAQVAKRILEAVFHQEVHADRIKLLTNLTHWGYGTSLGAMYGLIGRKLTPGRRPIVQGPLYGTAAWAMSYAMLVPMGLYEPPWRYPARTIAKDLSYHLVFGLGCAAGYRAVAKRGR